MQKETHPMPHKDSKFDADGDEIDNKCDIWLWWDRYFATAPGTEAASVALDHAILRHESWRREHL